MTVREVADLMRISSMTVYRMIKDGQLGAVRIGKGYRVPRRDVADYLRRHSQRAAPR